MGRRIALVVVFLIFCSFFGLCLAQVQSTRVAGVHAGEQFEYAIAGSGLSNASGSFFDYGLLQSATLTIDDVSGRNVTYHWDIHLSNGTSLLVSPWLVDVSLGIYYRGGLTSYFPAGLLVIASNLNAGDHLFTNPDYPDSDFINETMYAPTANIIEEKLPFVFARNTGDESVVLPIVPYNNFVASERITNSNITLNTGDVVLYLDETTTWNASLAQIRNVTLTGSSPVYTVQEYNGSLYSTVSQSQILARLHTDFPDARIAQNPSFTLPINHYGIEYTSQDGSTLTDHAYWEQQTGVPAMIMFVFHSANGSGDYSIQMIMEQPSMGSGAISDNKLSLQPFAFIKPPTVPPQQTLVVTAVGTGVVGLVSASAIVLSSLSTTRFDSLPDPLKRFVKGSVNKGLEQLFKTRENRKRSLITAGEIGALAAAVVFTALVVAFCDLRGYPQVLNLDLFLAAFSTALVSAVIVQSFSLIGDIICSSGVRAKKKLNLWNMGTLTWFASGLIVQLPFSSPSISKTVGDSKYKVKLQQRIAALNTAVKASMVSLLFIPFTLMSALNFLPAVGNTGLLSTTIALCCLLMPFKPFAGKEIRAYKKKLSVTLAVASIILVIAQYQKLLDTNTYLSIGFFGVIALIVVLWKLSSEKAKLRQGYPELWFR